VKEEEDSPLLSAPVITLKEESPIYKTKIGREITIAPIYENTDSETTFNWTIDGKSICTTSTLTFSADEAGRFLNETNKGIYQLDTMNAEELVVSLEKNILNSTTVSPIT
jgi:hypothetical protein